MPKTEGDVTYVPMLIIVPEEFRDEVMANAQKVLHTNPKVGLVIELCKENQWPVEALICGSMLKNTVDALWHQTCDHESWEALDENTRICGNCGHTWPT